MEEFKAAKSPSECGFWRIWFSVWPTSCWSLDYNYGYTIVNLGRIQISLRIREESDGG